MKINGLIYFLILFFLLSFFANCDQNIRKMDKIIDLENDSLLNKYLLITSELGLDCAHSRNFFSLNGEDFNNELLLAIKILEEKKENRLIMLKSLNELPIFNYVSNYTTYRLITSCGLSHHLSIVRMSQTSDTTAQIIDKELLNINDSIQYIENIKIINIENFKDLENELNSEKYFARHNNCETIPIQTGIKYILEKVEIIKKNDTNFVTIRCIEFFELELSYYKPIVDVLYKYSAYNPIKCP